jgi:hypothetical protein
MNAFAFVYKGCIYEYVSAGHFSKRFPDSILKNVIVRGDVRFQGIEAG